MGEVVTVSEVRAIADATVRVRCDDGSEVDVCTREFALVVGDRVRITCDAQPPMDADYIASGQAFALSTNFCFVSCGGNLAKIRDRVAPHVRVFLGIQKTADVGSSRVRTRGKRSRE